MFACLVGWLFVWLLACLLVCWFVCLFVCLLVCFCFGGPPLLRSGESEGDSRCPSFWGEKSSNPPEATARRPTALCRRAEARDLPQAALHVGQAGVHVPVPRLAGLRTFGRHPNGALGAGGEGAGGALRELCHALCQNGCSFDHFGGLSKLGCPQIPR